jgi:hypothetical protein
MRWLLLALLFCVAGCGGKSFVEAEAIYKDELAKLEALEAELSAKKHEATSKALHKAMETHRVELERRAPLLKKFQKDWVKENPQPVIDDSGIVLGQWLTSRGNATSLLSDDEVKRWEESHPRPNIVTDASIIDDWNVRRGESLKAFDLSLGRLPPDKPTDDELRALWANIDNEFQPRIDAQNSRVKKAEKAKEKAK